MLRALTVVPNGHPTVCRQARRSAWLMDAACNRRADQPLRPRHSGYPDFDRSYRNIFRDRTNRLRQDVRGHDPHLRPGCLALLPGCTDTKQVHCRLPERIDIPAKHDRQRSQLLGARSLTKIKYDLAEASTLVPSHVGAPSVLTEVSWNRQRSRASTRPARTRHSARRSTRPKLQESFQEGAPRGRTEREASCRHGVSCIKARRRRDITSLSVIGNDPI